MQAFATLVLVLITAYYAWTSRAQVKATQATLQATARMTLQSRLDRISELMLANPELFKRLDEPGTTGEERDERFHLANILFGIFEEAYLQHYVDRSMPDEEFRAWEATMDGLLNSRYLAGYWRLSRGFNESFTRYLNERVASEN